MCSAVVKMSVVVLVGLVIARNITFLNEALKKFFAILLVSQPSEFVFTSSIMKSCLEEPDPFLSTF